MSRASGVIETRSPRPAVARFLTRVSHIGPTHQNGMPTTAGRLPNWAYFGRQPTRLRCRPRVSLCAARRHVAVVNNCKQPAGPLIFSPIPDILSGFGLARGLRSGATRLSSALTNRPNGMRTQATAKPMQPMPGGSTRVCAAVSRRPRSRAKTWMMVIKQIYEADPLTCAKCGRQHAGGLGQRRRFTFPQGQVKSKSYRST